MSLWRLFYHVVWSTRDRATAIDDEREDVIRRSIRATCAEHGALVHGIGVMPDHVHLAVSIPPKIAISIFVRQLKGSSSHLVNHTEHGFDSGTFAWQAEYGILSFGERSLADVVAYVENQRARHADHQLLPTFEAFERPFDRTKHKANGRHPTARV